MVKEIKTEEKKDKGIFTQQQMPWVEYLEIDEKTLKRYLREDTPEQIKKMYEEYLKQIEEKSNKNENIEK